MGPFLTGTGCNTDFLSGVVEVIKFANEARLKRLTDFPLGEFPLGGVEKKDDLRWATIEADASGVVLELTEMVDSRLDFSARALILCEMPEDTLIFLAVTTLSGLTCEGHGPEALRPLSCSGEKRPGMNWLEVDLSGMEISDTIDDFREKNGFMGDFETETGLASSNLALCNSSMKESSERYSASELSVLW